MTDSANVKEKKFKKKEEKEHRKKITKFF